MALFLAVTHGWDTWIENPPAVTRPVASRWVWFYDSRPRRTHTVLFLLHSLFHLLIFLFRHKYIKLDLTIIPSPLISKTQITILLFFNLDIQLLALVMHSSHLSLIGFSFLAKVPSVYGAWVCMWMHAHMLGRWADAQHSKTSLIQHSRDPE